MSDTLIFTDTTPGCFSADAPAYTLVKLKNNARRVIIETENGTIKKKLKAKSYDAFVCRFSQSAQRFKYAGGQEGNLPFTAHSKLETAVFEFTNPGCEAEFNPEELLKKLMK